VRNQPPMSGPKSVVGKTAVPASNCERYLAKGRSTSSRRAQVKDAWRRELCAHRTARSNVTGPQ